MRACRAVRRARGLAVPLLLAAAIAAFPAARAEAVAGPAARAAPATLLTGTGVLNNVVATSATNAWAVGHFAGLITSKALIEHWNGTTWHRVRLSPASGWLDGVAATSASDVWAVGLSGARALILHFNGTAWRRVASPALGGARAVLADVTAVSPHNVWAVGVAGAKTLIEHWNGAAWKRVPSPSPQKGAILTGVSAASAGNAWAVGSTAGKTLTLHWNGATWRRVPSPGTSAALVRVAAISASDAWATGSSGRGVLILHWNGTVWRRTPGPAVGSSASLVGVSATSARNAWAVGITGGTLAAGTRSANLAALASTERPGSAAVTAPAPRPLILHWNGSAWRRMSIPVPVGGGTLIGVNALSGRNAWAVGCTRTFDDPKARPLALRWNGTAWK